VYYDPTTMMGQLGLMPKEAPPVRPAMEQGMEGAPVILVTADEEKEQANLAIAKKSDETFNSHKVADIMAMWADDAVESDQAGGMDHKGKKEIEKGMQTFFKAFSDVKVASEHTYAAGDYVVALGAFSGTNDGPLGPMKKTGKPVTGSYAEIYKISDGKIAELWRFRNGMAMAVQLGLMPDPTQAGAPGGEPATGDEPAKTDKKMDKKAAPTKKGM
jgi:predicted ester cyclase